MWQLLQIQTIILSVNRNISDFCLVRSIIHGIIWGEEEKYRSPIEKTMQVFNLFLQPYSANTVLRALRSPWGNIKWRKRINSLNESMTILNSQKKRFKLDRDRPLPLAIDQRLQEKKLHLSIYFFQQLSCPLWSFGQGWKPIQWGTLKRSWLLWDSREPVWKDKLFYTESRVAKNNTKEWYHFHTYRKSSSEVDVDAIKEQIREDYRKKLASLLNITK